jgi:hypothetical protein
MLLALAALPVLYWVGTFAVAQPAAESGQQATHQKPPLWRISELAGAGAQSVEQQQAAIPLGTPMQPRLGQGEPQLEYANA